jgi:hypothetical protein
VGLFRGRHINLVSVTLTLLLLAAGYLGWKFVPVYWQAHKVDTALTRTRWEASKIHLVTSDSREPRLLDSLREEILSLGVDERFLEVYFAPDYTSVHADYTALVHHPFGKVTTLEFERRVKVPRDDL